MTTVSNLKIAVICSSNMNRSMEAHAFLAKKGFIVKSFGTGEKVKIPGSSADKPNIYEFGTSYAEIYQDLLEKDKTLYVFLYFQCLRLFPINYTVFQKFCRYTQNGLLHTLDRNRRIKTHPEKFQETKEKFDILITCEERVYDQVLEFMESKAPSDNSIVHVINIDIQDNLEEATIGAFLISDMCMHVSNLQ